MDKNDIQYILMKDAEWCNHLGFSDFDGINEIIRNGKAIELVNLSEAKHENRFSTVAYKLIAQGGVRLILLAGPSASGKTSSSLRLALQCKIHGLNPRTIELDNYFKDRADTPRLPDGKFDYECMEAMDLDLLHSNLSDLISGREVVLPRYDFASGTKQFDGATMKLDQKDILIMEGIHALDPAMLPGIPDDVKYRVYVSDISSMSNYDPLMHTTDNRLLRRMTRDHRTRGISPERTILTWPVVRAGEEKYIFPFQKYADVVINSTLPYELPMLKHYVTPVLKGIKEDSPAYSEATRLLGFLNRIDELPVDAINAIPCTSLMREFIGGQILSRNLQLV